MRKNNSVFAWMIIDYPLAFGFARNFFPSRQTIAYAFAEVLSYPFYVRLFFHNIPVHIPGTKIAHKLGDVKTCLVVGDTGIIGYKEV